MEENNTSNKPLENKQLPIEPLPPKKRISKKLLIALSIVSVAVMGFAVYALLNRNSDSANNEQVTTSEEETTQLNTEESVKDTISVEGMEGLTFDVPDYWLVQKESVASDGLLLYSDDAVGLGEGYITISKGYSIRITSSERDKENEAGKSDPFEAYSGNVGAPRIDDGSDFYSQPIDTSRFKKFTNKNDLQMQAYPWAYEGCYEQVIFLDETKVYYVAIYDGESCPDNDILDNNDVIKRFIDSIRLTKEKATLIFDGAFITPLYAEKENLKTLVETSDVSFTFSASQPDEVMDSFYILQKVPLLSDFEYGSFKRLVFGSPRSVVKDTYGCDGCGSLSLLYDESIEYHPTVPSTEGYEKIEEGMYGKVVPTDAVQAKGQATTYSYVRQLDDKSYITYTVTMEILKDADMTLPELKNEALLQSVRSFTLVR